MQARIHGMRACLVATSLKVALDDIEAYPMTLTGDSGAVSVSFWKAEARNVRLQQQESLLIAILFYSNFVPCVVIPYLFYS